MSVEVGETVWLFDVNRKGRTEGTVTKVGRKLVTIRHGLYNTESTFRLDTQRSNDEYQHQWFKTPEQAAQDQTCKRLVEGSVNEGSSCLRVQRACT